MSNGSSKRTRSDRVAAVRLPPGKFRRALDELRRNDVLLRLGLCLFGAVCLWIVTWPWSPPAPFRIGDVPQRDIMARVTFEAPDEGKTKVEEQRRRDQTERVYRHDPQRLDNLISDLVLAVGKVKTVANYDEAESDDFRQKWGPFIGYKFDRDSAEKQTEFENFRRAIPASFEQVIKKSLEPFRRHGLLDELHERGNRTDIYVYLIGQPAQQERVKVSSVYLDAPDSNLKKLLEEDPSVTKIAVFIYEWLRHRLNADTATLTLDADESRKLQDIAAGLVKKQMRSYPPGERIVRAGVTISDERLKLLKLEHHAWLSAPGNGSSRFYRSAAMLGLIVGLLIPGGFYLYYREPRLRKNSTQLAIVFLMAIATVAAAQWLATLPSRLEVIPLVFFGMTVAIAYQRELAILLSTAVIGVFVLAIDRNVTEFFLLLGVVSTAVLLLTGIRTRVKLIQICSIAGGVACLGTLLLGILDGRLDSRVPGDFQLEGTLWMALLADALWMALWTLTAGVLITGLLPFIEWLFGVLTDLSLLELGDVSHPLLQELVRRAPGTYNHSINVGAMAEAASDAIGARGLLVRVGAYFHDIGKMLKPAYFVENQGQDNRHEALAPAMSTLIIIAHIKDGADLARQHHLPQAFVDFIEQHHGTTLVEFFYQRAAQERDSNPDASAVEEGDFRYPGPKPQTKEAAVLMLADAVESASRTLADPAPARIESLVEEIVMKRLMDDQFDECAINLKELRIVQDSLMKSLIAVYHGRVKYPTQRTA